MVVHLRVTSPRSQVLLGKRVAAWRAASSQVEGASTEVVGEAEAQADAVKAWKSIGQLS
jgi:hypothetical protein